jgi:hypothetical protein
MRPLAYQLFLTSPFQQGKALSSRFASDNHVLSMGTDGSALRQYVFWSKALPINFEPSRVKYQPLHSARSEVGDTTVP